MKVCASQIVDFVILQVPAPNSSTDFTFELKICVVVCWCIILEHQMFSSRKASQSTHRNGTSRRTSRKWDQIEKRAKDRELWRSLVNSLFHCKYYLNMWQIKPLLWHVHLNVSKIQLIYLRYYIRFWESNNNISITMQDHCNLLRTTVRAVNTGQALSS